MVFLLLIVSCNLQTCNLAKLYCLNRIASCSRVSNIAVFRLGGVFRSIAGLYHETGRRGTEFGSSKTTRSAFFRLKTGDLTTMTGSTRACSIRNRSFTGRRRQVDVPRPFAALFVVCLELLGMIEMYPHVKKRHDRIQGTRHHHLRSTQTNANQNLLVFLVFFENRAFLIKNGHF